MDRDSRTAFTQIAEPKESEQKASWPSSRLKGVSPTKA